MHAQKPRARTAAVALLSAALTALFGCGVRSGGDVATHPDAGSNDAAALDAGAADATAELDAASVSQHCSAYCAAVVAAHCSNDDALGCTQSCDDDHAARPSCAAVLDAWLACAAALPTSEWSCDFDGFATPAVTSCQTERDARAACR